MSETIAYSQLSWPVKVSVIVAWLIVARFVVGLVALAYLFIVGG